VDYLSGQARGCRVARAVGVQTEMELAFAGLHQLCAPMLGRADHLPVPQRDALRTAFGLTAGPPPDRFLVGLVFAAREPGAELAGGFGLPAEQPGATPLSERISESFRRQLEALPSPSRRLLVYTGTFLGRRCESTVVCTDLAANKRFATRTTAGPFDLEVDITLEPSPGGTRVLNTCRGESRGFYKLAEPLVVRLTKKQTEAAYDNLRTLLEEGAL
jgi:hypothetical protein